MERGLFPKNGASVEVNFKILEEGKLISDPGTSTIYKGDLMFLAMDQLTKAFKIDKAHPEFYSRPFADVRHKFTNYERLIKMIKPWQYRTFKNYVNDKLRQCLKGE